MESPHLFSAILRDTIKMILMRLSPSSLKVYLALTTYANFFTGGCFPTRRTLAADTGLSLDSVKRSLPKLKKAGLLTWVTGGPGRSNAYTVHGLATLGRDRGTSAPPKGGNAAPQEGASLYPPTTVTKDLKEKDLWFSSAWAAEVGTFSPVAQWIAEQMRGPDVPEHLVEAVYDQIKGTLLFGSLDITLRTPQDLLAAKIAEFYDDAQSIKHRASRGQIRNLPGYYFRCIEAWLSAAWEPLYTDEWQKWGNGAHLRLRASTRTEDAPESGA